MTRRVLHVTTTYGKRSEGFVVDAVTAVEPSGWESWVLCADAENRGDFPAPPDARVRQVGRHALLDPPAPLGHRRSLERLIDDDAAAVLPLLDGVEPALVHAHFGWNAFRAWGVARALQVPLAVTFHASDVTVFPPVGRRQRLVPAWARYRTKYDPLLAHVDLPIAVSGYIAERVRALGFQAPVLTVPAGVNVADWPFREPRLTGPARLVYVGRLVARKGVDVLLHALADGRPPALDIVGDGPEQRALRELADRLGLDVTFHGALARPQVRAVLAAGAVLVMPSRQLPSGEVEGSPVVVKEAQALGLPVIATRTGGTAESIAPPWRDFLVEPDDPPALRRMIDRLLEHRATWGAGAGAARTFVEQQFDWRELGVRTAAGYEQALNDKRRTQHR